MSLSPLLKILLIVAALALVGVWLMVTPPGLLGKIDAIGYSVCHQAPARSFAIGERPTPLCARCTGTFLGALLGLIYLFRLGRRGEIPPLSIGLVLILLAAFWALDGVNSFARLIPGLPHLYSSQNWLRLASGTGLGLGLAAILVPVFNQSIWIDYVPIAALGQWRHLAGLMAVGTLGALGIFSQNPLLIYPLAVLSGLGVLALLTAVYTVVWVLLSKTENRYHTIKELWFPLLAGFTTAMLQVCLIDAGRFWLTGTWSGFPLPN
jgi:uncharacterized membrane protein